jgi:RND superfamily putative drug exporter
MSLRVATFIVRMRVVIVVGWAALAVAATLALPSIREAQVGSLGDLVPVDAEAIDTEERAAELFSFPVLSRSVIVVRDPRGLTIPQQARVVERLVALNRGVLPALRQTRGFPVPNAIGGRRPSEDPPTTLLVALLFPPDVGQSGRNDAARRFAEEHLREIVPGGYVGVTGAIPARAEQSSAIEDHLPLVEIATLLFILAAVGFYFRSPLAPIVNLVAVALAYLVCIRVVALLGRTLGVSVPSEVQPVIVALLFGVVTDYKLFFLSRYRRRMSETGDARTAATQTTAELMSIIITCGMAVAAACSALFVAELGFLRAFGPGLAMAVLVAMAVTVTFIPAAMSLLGNALFWPATPRRERPGTGTPGRGDLLMRRLVTSAVRRPRRTIAACLIALAAMSSGALFMHLGNPIIRGLPSDSGPTVAYAQALRGFVPGAISPTVVLVERDGVVGERLALDRLQRLLAAEPGVARVVGPSSNPAALPFGAVLARNGDAARYVIILRANPLGAGAIERVRRLRESVPDLAERAGLADVSIGFAGDTVLSQETIDGTVDDLWRVIPAVLLAVLLVLVIFLRGLVAPLYLVVTAALAPLAALGLSVAFFQGVLGHGELSYFVPVAAGVLLVALGSDYNIFLVGRVWDEAKRRPLDEAIISAGAGAARAISAAGIVLAVSFAAMALVPIRSFQELGFIMAVGLLIDAFLVRTILVPATIAFAGYRSGWPGRWLKRPPDRRPNVRRRRRRERRRAEGA